MTCSRMLAEGHLTDFFCQFYLCEGGFPFYLDLNVSRLVFHYFFWFARPSSHPLVLCSHIHTAIHIIIFDFLYIYYITAIDFCGNFQCILGEKIGAIRYQKTTKCLASGFRLPLLHQGAATHDHHFIFFKASWLSWIRKEVQVVRYIAI